MSKGVKGTVVINMESVVNDKRAKPCIDEPMLAVLHVDDMGEWAVYVGKESDGAEYVQKRGDKVPLDMARFLFPNWVGHYRV